MNIEDITLGQLRQIQEIPLMPKEAPDEDGGGNYLTTKLVGKYCIIRAEGAGVHAGTLLEHSGTDVVLADSRRLWAWKAKEGHTLSAVAVNGIDKVSQVPLAIPLILIKGVCEIIPASEVSRETIESQSVYHV